MCVARSAVDVSVYGIYIVRAAIEAAVLSDMFGH
jgi:hypothetical protein